MSEYIYGVNERRQGWRGYCPVGYKTISLHNWPFCVELERAMMRKVVNANFSIESRSFYITLIIALIKMLTTKVTSHYTKNYDNGLVHVTRIGGKLWKVNQQTTVWNIQCAGGEHGDRTYIIQSKIKIFVDFVSISIIFINNTDIRSSINVSIISNIIISTRLNGNTIVSSTVLDEYQQ